jgi:hypothetical protein
MIFCSVLTGDESLFHHFDPETKRQRMASFGFANKKETICLFVCMCVYYVMYVYICTYICVYYVMYVYICVCIYVYICMYVCVLCNVRIYMCIYMYVCVLFM